MTFIQRIATYLCAFVLAGASPFSGLCYAQAETQTEEDIQAIYETVNEQFESLVADMNQLNRTLDRLAKEAEQKRKNRKSDLKAFETKGGEGIDQSNILYLTTTSGFTTEELDRALEGTALAGLGQAYKQAEDDHGVNAIFLMAVANHESAKGTSRIAKDKNNLFGFTANDSDPYNLSTTFKSRAACIDYVAKFLKKNYLTQGGTYYNGISAKGVNVRYASDPDWATKVENEMVRLTSRIIQK